MLNNETSVYLNNNRRYDRLKLFHELHSGRWIRLEFFPLSWRSYLFLMNFWLGNFFFPFESFLLDNLNTAFGRSIIFQQHFLYQCGVNAQNWEPFSSQFQERSHCKWILCFNYYLTIFKLPKKTIFRCSPLTCWRKPLFNRITIYQDRTKTSGHGEKPVFNNEISL